MTRAVSSAHLGGIGLMLEVARMCPRCGKRLSDSPSAAAWHFERDGCHPVVYAALPEPEAHGSEEDPPIPAGRQIHDFEIPAVRSRREPTFIGLDSPPVFDGAGRALAVPWLRPPDLGEVL